MKQFLYGILLVLFSLQAIGQSAVPQPDVQKLAVNSSPAFILLGVQPDNIQRPSTPRDFVASIQSAVVNKQLQPNFSLETNPFNWNKKTNSNQFYANDYFYRSSQAIKKNFALSLATSTSDTVVFGQLQPGLGLGYGLRFTIVPGKVNTAVAAKFLEWEDAEVESILINIIQSSVLIGRTNFSPQEFDNFYTTVAQSVKTGIANGKYLLEQNRPDLLVRLKSLSDSYKGLSDSNFTIKLHQDDLNNQRSKNTTLSAINNLANRLTAPFDREGFTLELAAAGVTIFQQNQWNMSHFGKSGIWLTPAYRLNIMKGDQNDLTQSIDFMGVFRYIWNDKKVDTASYLDMGAKLQFNRTAWNASAEWVARHASEVPDTIHSHWTNSWLVSFSYTINQLATLKFSFGSNFDGNTHTYSQPKNMFVVGGVNFGIFQNK
jgi:hypothetical protein